MTEHAAAIVGLVVMLVSAGCATAPGVQDSFPGNSISSDFLVRFENETGGFGTTERSTGTGFFYGDSGTVVSVAHLFPGYNTDAVVTGTVGGIERTFRILRIDPSLDLCVLQAEEYVSPAFLDPATGYHAGQPVIVTGFPTHIPGYTGAYFTSGIVSATDYIEFSDGDVQYRLISTDAFATIGNSGGPVLDQKGDVIGMVQAVFSPDDDYRGVTLFVPIETVDRVLDVLREEDNYDYLGGK
jgi:S1-C subfamily serine protease